MGNSLHPQAKFTIMHCVNRNVAEGQYIYPMSEDLCIQTSIFLFIYLPKPPHSFRDHWNAGASQPLLGKGKVHPGRLARTSQLYVIVITVMPTRNTFSIMHIITVSGET